MSLKDDLIKDIDGFFEGTYTVTEGRAIPSAEDLTFSKSGRELQLAMLFIDIRESTKIVDGIRRTTAARMYKSFLRGVSKISRNNSGSLLSFNGDGILVGFIGDSKNSNAAKTALQLTWFVKDILKPKMQEYFSTNTSLSDMDFDFGVGIDSGKVLVVRGGMQGQGNNDLVWVGNTTNYAVKLSDLGKDGFHIHITKEVYDHLNEDSKLGGDPKRDMWEAIQWNGITIYRSNWYWSL